MELSFYKLYTGPNDTLLVNSLSENLPLRSFLSEELPGEESSLSIIARRLCMRREGVGANGVVYLFKGENHPVSARFFLPDGTEQTISHDALLCLAKFSFDSGLSGKERLIIEAGESLRTVESIDSTNFRISIGQPRTDSGAEIRELPDGEYTRTITVKDRKITVTPVRFQTSGAAIFFEDARTETLKEISRSIRKNKEETESPQPVFVKVLSREDILIRTWFSRGAVDYCEPAAIASVASVLNGLVERDVVVHVGEHLKFVQWLSRTNEVYVTSSPEYAFSGNFYVEDELLSPLP